MARKKNAILGLPGWFATFADLMAVIVSFLVMLVAMSTQNKEKLQIVAGSMREAFGTQRDTRLDGIMEQNGIPFRPHLRNVMNLPPEFATDTTAPAPLARHTEGLQRPLFDRRFTLAAASLRQALQEHPEISALSKQVLIEETKDGLDIQIVDQDGRAMFPEDSALPYERLRQVLAVVAPQLRRLSNRIRVTGHTSAARSAARPGSGAWVLSTQRALAVRSILADNGVADDRFGAIVGKGDTEPLFPDAPGLPANRRIGILVMHEAPPLPLNARP